MGDQFNSSSHLVENIKISMLMSLALALILSSLTSGQKLFAPAPQCQTEFANTCIFPFKFRGKTFRSCTFEGTTNGKAWCATRVNPRNNNVIPGQWEDCDPSLCLI